ncbi:MAG: hypothetical protein N4A76_15160 [Firmicutes bacterium]|jgi:formylmethanofuran dehydrogenase subunit E|nr:hypothetical protein [Bacillota bacterium]
MNDKRIRVTTKKICDETKNCVSVRGIKKIVKVSGRKRNVYRKNKYQAKSNVKIMISDKVKLAYPIPQRPNYIIKCDKCGNINSYNNKRCRVCNRRL